MTATTFEPSTITANIYRRVKGRILDASLAPGERVVIDQIARDLGVSLRPVRESIRLLEKDGRVEHVPHRGAVVKRNSTNDALDFFAVRERLEALAAGLAPSRIDETGQKKLQAVLTDAETALAAGKMDGYVEADWAFHAAVANLGRNKILSAMYQSLNDRFRTYLKITSPQDGVGPHEGHAHHQTIFQSIHVGDSEEAERRMVPHNRWSLDEARKHKST